MSDASGMEFDRSGGKKAKYIPVDNSRGNILEMMMTTWNLQKPNLIISVTGNESDCSMNERLYDFVRGGLRSAATVTGAWIFTSGTSSGVPKIVGKVFCGTRPVVENVKVIGILAMDCIQNMDSSTENNSESSTTSKSEEVEKGFLPSKYSKLLDHNHSHFIVLKDAKQRTELEKNISKIDNNDIPIVQIVLGGGYETLENVYYALQTNTPTVVVKGAKGVAFIIAYSFLNAQERENSKMRFMDASLEDTVRGMLKREFPSNDVNGHLDRIRKCLDKSDYIHVCDLDNKEEIDSIILQALLKDNKYEIMDMLRMTLAFNKIEVAKSYIFTDANSMQIGCLDNLMLAAIKLNRFDFVKLFLDNGISLKIFLTKRRLLNLYETNHQTCLLRSLLENEKSIKKQNDRKNDLTLEDVRMLVQNLIGISSEEEADETTLIAPNDGKNKTIRKDFKNPSLDLFIWSILMVRQDMAKIFWIHGKDALPKALVGYHLLKRLRSKIDNTDTELVNEIQRCINEWAIIAVDFLRICQVMGEQATQYLLVRNLSYLGNISCFVIAMSSEHKEFISQNACQTLLNNIWNGRLAHENSLFRLMCCMFCPILAIRVLTFTIHKDTFSKVESAHGKAGDGEANPEESLQKPSEKKKCKPSTNEKRSLMRQTTSEKMKPDREQITPRKKLYYFFKAPLIICMYNVLTYVIFLSMYAFVLIFNFGSSVSTPDIALMVYVFTIFTEEVRQVVRTSSSGLRSKLQHYISDDWNKVDILTIVLFITGMTVRFLPYDGALEGARVILALNFISFCLRLLHIFSVHKQLGPKLVMIREMLADLMYFIVILMVFVVSYAIASHSILYPNSPLTWTTVMQVVRNSYWNIYGELFIDEIEGGPNCMFDELLWGNGTYPRCPSDVGKVVVPILMGGFMLVASVLLLNLLIAMFNYTFEKVHAETNKHWCFQRYSLISDYITRPVLCHPFNVLTHLYLLVRYVFARCCKKTNDQTRYNKFNRKFREEIEKELIQWENSRVKDYHQQQEKRALGSLDGKIDSSNEMLSGINEQLQQLRSAHLEMKHQIDTSIQRIVDGLCKTSTTGTGHHN